MIIVSGRIYVAPEERESYLADCVGIVERSRRTAGCLDFAISADLLDPGRVNIFERWESRAAVETARGGGPGNEDVAALRSASVADYDVADVRPFLEKGPG